MSKEPISEEEYAQLEQYLGGRMPPADRSAFERLLQERPDLRSAHEDYRAILAALGDAATHQVMHERIARWAQQAPPLEDESAMTTPPASKGRRKPLLPWAIAAGIALLLILGLVWWNRPTASERLFANYFEADPRSRYTLGSHQGDPAMRAMAAYQSRDYKTAIDEFTAALTADPHNDTLHYFQANAMLAEGEYELAESSLADLCRGPASPFGTMSCWYLSLAMVAQGKYDAAHTHLQAMAADDAHPMQKSAHALLIALGKGNH
jgi:anti-sigma factor RsiW